MFASTKVKTIGAPTMWDLTNVLGSKQTYKSDNHEREQQQQDAPNTTRESAQLCLRSNVSNCFLHMAKPHFYYTTSRVNAVSGNNGH
jgi:hypothetical protein